MEFWDPCRISKIDSNQEKVLIRLDWNPSIKFAGKKVLMRSKVVSQAGAKLS
jgi:hypothetical protein